MKTEQIRSLRYSNSLRVREKRHIWVSGWTDERTVDSCSLSLIKKDKGYYYSKNRLRDRERALIQSERQLAFMPLCTQNYEGTQCVRRWMAMWGKEASDLKHIPLQQVFLSKTHQSVSRIIQDSPCSLFVTDVNIQLPCLIVVFITHHLGIFMCS